MKNGTLAMKLILAVIMLTVIVYFGINIAVSLMDPFSTTPAYSYVSEHAVTVSGYVVRDEEVLPDSGDLVYFSRGEGERVAAGGTLALVCQSSEALYNASSLNSAREQLQQLYYARSLATGAQTAARLDDDISSALVSFHSAQAQEHLPDAMTAAANLRAAVLKRSYAYSGVTELETAIADLEADIAQLQSSVGPTSQAVKAPRSGLFSSLVDGYEKVLTPASLTDMTPEDFRTLEPEANVSGMGKMVYGSTWQFVTLMRTEDMEHLKEGDRLTLRFQTGLDRDLSMRVKSISQEDHGQKLVVLESHDYLHLTTLLRHQNAQLIFHSYSGLRVPRSAVRIVQVPMEDEEGQPLLDDKGEAKTEAASVVYCLWGRYAKLKPVEIVWQEKDYLLVTPSEGVSGQRRLRSGDTVITAAEDLYDGKVIE